MEPSEPNPGAAFECRLRADAILPPVCPVCLAPGVRPRPVPTTTTAGGRGASPLTAHYCEDCFDRIEKEATRHLAWLLLGGLLSVVSVLTLALIRGHTSSADLLVGASFLLLPRALSNHSQSPILLLEANQANASTAPERRLISLHRGFAELCDPGAQRCRAPASRKEVSYLLLSPALALLTFLIIAHGLELRLWVLPYEEESIALIDHTRTFNLRAAKAERASAGYFVRLLPGRHELSLLRPTGELLSEATVDLEARSDLVFGVPPAGQCLFLQTLTYGKAEPEPSEWLELRGGPVYPLPHPIDSWLKTPDPPEGVRSQGGLVRALRLRPCDSPLAPKGG